MYFGQQPAPQPAVLQLTGQLTIMTHPAHLQHLQQQQHVPQYVYPMPSYEPTHSQHPPPPQTARSPLHTPYMEKPQQYPPSSQANHPSQREHQLEHRQHPPEQAREQRGGMSGLEGRVEQLENMCCSMRRVNAQTLEAFSDMKNELVHRITAHEKESMKEMQKLQEMSNKLERKSEELLKKQEQRMKDEEEILEIRRQELQSMMKNKMREKMLEPERGRAKQLREEQLQQLARQMDRHRASTEDKLQEMKGEMKRLEQRVQLQIDGQVKRLSTSVKVVEERTQGQVRRLMIQLREQEQENKRMLELSKSAAQQYVIQTPNASCFTIHQNTITRSSGDDNSYRMVLLDVKGREGVFSFRTYIHNIKDYMRIGVTDRVTQQEKNWPEDKHSIYYYCSNGRIYYATAGDYYQYKKDGIAIRKGMQLLVEVRKCEVSFTVLQGRLSQGRWKVFSPILNHPGRQFIPFFALPRIGDKISWALK